MVSDATFRDMSLQNVILAPACVQVTNGSVCGISVPNGGIMSFFKMQLRVSVSVVPLKKRMHSYFFTRFLVFAAVNLSELEDER